MRVKIPRREILRYFGWRFYTGCMMVLALGFSASPAWAASESPQSFTYQGQLLDSSGHPMTGTVSLVVGIYSSSNLSCLLYEESLISLDLTPTQGLFSIAVGGPFDSNHARTALDPGLSLSQVFANTGAFTRAAGSPNCVAGYAPAPGDKRVLRLTVTPQGGTAVSFEPGQTIDSAPQALVAETLQGIGPSGFLQPKASSNLSQTTLEQLTSAADASTLHHHDSQYAKLSASSSISLSSGSYLGLGSRATDPVGLGAGDVGKTWYDSTANVIKYWDGSAVKQLGVAGSGLTGLTGDVSASGAGSVAATVNTVGGVTSANVALGANAANAATNANTVSTIVKRDASGNFSAGTITLSADPTLALQAATKQYVDTVNTNLTSAKVAKAGDTMTGALILPAGTAAAPSLGVGSTGNGLYYPAANQLGVSINGAEKVRVDSNGNVGIGTASPSSKLHVAAGTVLADFSGVDVGQAKPLYKWEYPGTLRYGVIQFDGTGDGSIGMTSATDLNLITNNLNRISILSGGNVGIGTTAPSTLMHVVGTTDTGVSTHGLMVLGATNTINISIDQNEIMARNNGAVSPLHLNNDGGDVIINGTNATGNVGIGTTSPQTRLEINNRFRTTGGGTAPTSGTGVNIEYDGVGSQGRIFAFDHSAPVGKNLLISDTFNVQYSAAVNMTLTSAGNLGIGTIAPSNTLSVTPLQYNTGTASQSLTTVTGVGTTWTSAMVGSQFVFANGVSAGTITAFSSATSLTVTTSQTVTSQAYKIGYTGLQVDSTGNVGIGTTVPNAKVAITSADYNAVSLANTNADATAKGAVITGSRSTNANVPYASFGTWDDGTYRYTMIGGGAFSRPDSTLITFYTASAYDETNGTGANERMRITSAGNVGIGTATPGASSILDISSTTKGVVLPRMTKAQRDAIASPVAGMAIYQTDLTPGLRVHNGTNWMRFTETAD